MTKFIVLLSCLLISVNAGKRGSEKISLEDIERDLSSNEKSSSGSQVKESAVQSPTKFGYVPTRTASSYAAATSKPQYYQTNYAVKSSNNKQQYQQPLQAEYTQQYINTYAVPSSSDYAQQYYDAQQYLTQQYAYAQAGEKQEDAVDYQQPGQQYDQYSNVQYVTDNSVSQPESQQQYSQSPQYYYVQQQQAPSSSVQTVVNPKSAVQYVTYVPSYKTNSIPVDQKYQTSYTTTYTTQGSNSVGSSKGNGVASKYYSSKQYSRPKSVQYVQSAPSSGYYNQEEVVIKREPKSLLDSYVPSILQLQYVREQQGSKYSKH